MTRVCGKSKLPGTVSLSFEEAATATFPATDPRFEQLRRLTEISRALTYATSLPEVTRLTVERGSELLDGSATVLLLPDAQGLLHVRASARVSAELLERFSAPLGDELISRLQGLLSVPADRFIAVPLIVGGEVTGVLAATTALPYTTADEWLLSALADQTAVALENARLGGEVRIDMETRLRASEGATDAKDRALSTLAHDIRTPIGAIDAYCSILQDEIQGPINDRQRETLGRVRMSGRHLLSLLDNVMEMARITADAVHMVLESIRLIDVARDAAQMLLPAADAKFQVLNVTELQTAIVLGDPGRLRQILTNLIGNAVKFTPSDGAVFVTIGLGKRADASYGEIRVSDTGPGIPELEQQAIFEPYYRSKATAQTPGVGLGLAISYALVRQMGGEVLLESQVGSGSTFIVRLPTA